MTDTQNTTKHIAIMMDGNRRWAKEKGLPEIMGHSEGSKTLQKIVRKAQQINLSYLTVWALSTENLKERSEKELNHLFSLFEKFSDEFDTSKENNLKIKVIGDLSKLPNKTEKKLTDLVEKTNNHTGLTLILAINYGGRDEIVRAIKKIIKKNLPADELSEEKFNDYLDTAEFPEPDLIIRTGGAIRMSGYLAWQSTYSELYFTPTYWPAFSETDLDKAIEWFQNQKRNRGK